MRWMLLIVLTLSHAAWASEGETIAEADRLWGLRGSSDRAQEAVDYLQTATADHPDSYDLHWRLARAAWWIADGTENADVDKAKGKLGWDAGARALELNSSDLEGRYWMTLSMGEYAKGISILKAIGQGIDGKFTEHIDHVLAADEDYDDAGALRAKSKYWSSLPRFMRKYDRAQSRLERADELVPNHPRNLFYLAELHHILGDDATARDYLDKSLGCTSWPDAPERARVMSWARALDSEIP